MTRTNTINGFLVSSISIMQNLPLFNHNLNVGNSAYLKNLFFVYLIELRALYKSQPYLLDKIKWKMVGDKAEARDAIKDLLKTDK